MQRMCGELVVEIDDDGAVIELDGEQLATIMLDGDVITARKIAIPGKTPWHIGGDRPIEAAVAAFFREMGSVVFAALRRSERSC